MKASPKLQDTLEVFLVELEKLETTFKDIKEFSPLIASKINELKKVTIEPNLQNLKSEFSVFENLSTQKIKKFEELFNENQKKISESFSKQRSSLSNFYFYTLVLFLITCGSIFIAVQSYQETGNYKKQLVENKSYTMSLEEFIKESKQIQKYNKWLDSKKRK